MQIELRVRQFAGQHRVSEYVEEIVVRMRLA
jgi:hypothetical protein